MRAATILSVILLLAVGIFRICMAVTCSEDPTLKRCIDCIGNPTGEGCVLEAVAVAAASDDPLTTTTTTTTTTRTPSTTKKYITICNMRYGNTRRINRTRRNFTEEIECELEIHLALDNVDESA
ncbi:uncharacterized protein LOC122818518 [Drosophila biarmipes]|uniref:uncharacterized protein LOC122818518 n=1 Tax=Drosophila biarmipes TaxID=125945 RepID=UPI001CDA6D92|nr:uncharacterized protein LOC122818518 [Drosophila biarmipes]